jgi:hypothetical protein
MQRSSSSIVTEVHHGVQLLGSPVHWEFGRDPILIVEGRKKIEVGERAAEVAA